MESFEHAVFISYAWGDEREEIVNKIDQTLHKRGIRIIRDKRDLGYKGSITDFMECLGRGNCVIVVVRACAKVTSVFWWNGLRSE